MDRLSGSARPDLFLGRANEYLQHLGGTDAVDDFQAGSLMPCFEGRQGQRLAGRDTFTQARRSISIELLKHRPVGRGSGEAHCGTMPSYSFEQMCRAGLLQKHGGGSGPHWEENKTAKPVCEAQRWSADKDVVRIGPQHVSREAIRGCQNIAMCVHGALWLPGAPRGEG